MDTIDTVVKLWHLLGLTVALVAGILMVVFIMADKSVQSYYLGPGLSLQPAFCVTAEHQWDVDVLIFCTDDKDRVLDFVRRANETLRSSQE